MIQEASRKFIAVEKAADLFKYSYRDIPVWWFCRMHVFAECVKIESAIDLGMNKASALTPRQTLKYAADVFRLPRFHQHPILAVSTSSARRSRIENKDFDAFFDPISWTRFREDYAIFETPDRMRHRSEPLSSRRYYGDQYLFRGNLLRRVGAGLSALRFSPALEELVRIIEKALRAEDLTIERAKLRQIVYAETAFAIATIPYAGDCLDRVQPKILLVQSGGSSSRLAFQMAAKKRSIRVVEIQHGLIVEDSPMYFAGYCGEPERMEPVPDEMLVFGEHFKRVLAKSSVCANVRVTVVGNPYFQWQRKHFIETARPVKGTLLVTTIPELSGFYSRFVLELQRKYKGHILLKPHPSESDRAEALYAEVKKLPRVSLLSGDVSLYDALSRAEFHISAGSQTHMEAISVGVKDIILASAGFEDFVSFLVERGIPLAHSVDDVIRLIDSYPCIEPARRYVDKEVWALGADSTRRLERALVRSLSPQNKSAPKDLGTGAGFSVASERP